MSVPTKVTNIRKVIERGSTRMAISMDSSPAGTQRYTTVSMTRSLASIPSICTIAAAATPKDAVDAAIASQWPHELVTLPATSRKPALRRGIATHSQIRLAAPVAGSAATLTGMRLEVNSHLLPSVLELVRTVKRGGPMGSENGYDDGKANHNFCGGHNHDEEGKNLTLNVSPHA